MGWFWVRSALRNESALVRQCRSHRTPRRRRSGCGKIGKGQWTTWEIEVTGRHRSRQGRLLYPRRKGWYEREGRLHLPVAY